MRPHYASSIRFGAVDNSDGVLVSGKPPIERAVRAMGVVTINGLIGGRGSGPPLVNAERAQRETGAVHDLRRLPAHAEGIRLHLRRWTPDDVERISTAVEHNLDHLRPWMSWAANEPLSAEERRDLLERWEHEWRGGGDVVMAILVNDEVVGGSGLHRRCGPDGLEIGYWVDKDHLGRGIATEAASALTSAGLSVPGISFIEIHHDKANVRSSLVPRRLGYAFLGESPDGTEAPAELGIDCAWRMTAESWQSRSVTDPRPTIP